MQYKSIIGSIRSKIRQRVGSEAYLPPVFSVVPDGNCACIYRSVLCQTDWQDQVTPCKETSSVLGKMLLP